MISISEVDTSSSSDSEEQMNSDSSSSSDDESISRDTMIEGKQNHIINHPKQAPPQLPSRTTDRRQHSKLFEKVNLDSDDDSDGGYDKGDDEDVHSDDSDHNDNDDVNNETQSTSDDDDTSRSEFEDDDGDDDKDNDDHGDHIVKIKTNDDDLRHLPLSERLRHIQMEQGINKEYKEQRKRKHEESQQQIQNVKELILKKKQEKKDGATNDSTAQSKMTNHDKCNKKSKHAPTVMSSKRPDFYHRQRLDIQGGGIAAIGTNIQVHTNVYKGRDPRSIIDMNSSSTNNQKNSSKRGGKKLLETIKGTSNNVNDYQCEDYAFIQEMRNEEIQKLQKRIKARQLTGRKGQEHRRRYNVQSDSDGLLEDQSELHRLQQEKANYERKQLEIATKRAVQQRLREGNTNRQRNHSSEADTETNHNNNDDEAHFQPLQQSSKYVPKVRELKRMYLETKYDLLSQQKKGKNTIDKMILKKHMKNKSKDSKKQHI